MSRSSLVLAVLALLALAPPGARAASRAEERLARLERHWAARVLERQPQRASALGLHERDDAVVPVTQAWIDEQRAWLGNLAAALDSLPDSALAPARSLDRRVLARWVAAERFDLDERRVWERDPGAYLDLTVGAVAPLLDRRSASACERVRLITRRLQLLPEVLRAARINLSHPSRVAVEDALDRFTGAVAFLRIELPARSAVCHDPYRQAALAEADTLAVGALESFITYLHDDLLPRADGEVALGRERFERLAAIEGLAGVPPPGDSAATSVAGAGAAPAVAIPGRAGIDSVLHVLRDAVGGGARPSMGVRLRPAWARFEGPIARVGPGPFERDEAPGWLEVDARAFADSTLPPAATLALANGATLRGRIGRPAPGGGSATRRATLPEAFVSGWSQYGESAADSSPGVAFRSRVARVDAWRRGSWSVCVAIHTAGMTVADARRELETRWGAPAALAEALARQAALAPETAMGRAVAERLLASRERWGDGRAADPAAAEARARAFEAAVVRLAGAGTGELETALERERQDPDRAARAGSR